MKKIMYLLFAVVLLSCQQVSDKSNYTVIGDFTSKYAGQTITMFNTHTNVVLDSMIIEKPGSFEFQGSIETPIIVELRANKRKVMEFVLESDTVVLDIHKRIASNTKSNNLLAEYLAAFDLYKNKEISKYELIQNSDISFDDKTRKIDSLTNHFLSSMHDLIYEKYNKHENDIIGTCLFLQLYQYINPEEFTALMSTASEMTREYPKIKQISDVMHAQLQTAAGKKYVDFTIENGTMDSTSVSLSEFVGHGKYTLVDFFASWCGPCIREIPHIRKIHDNYASQVQCVGVAVWDKPSATLKTIENSNITWPVIFNAQSLPTEIYGIGGIPEIILINPEGIIVARGLRGDAIEVKIREELKL